MRSIGMTQFKLKSQLQEWLDLSTQKGIPIFLLIMSRAFMLSSAGSGGAAATASGGQQPHHTVASAKASDPEQVLKTSMSFLDSDTINEVVLNAAKEEEDSNDMRRRRLESIQFQKEVSFFSTSSVLVLHFELIPLFTSIVSVCRECKRNGWSRRVRPSSSC